MIKSLNGLALRFFQVNKFLSFSTIISIAVSICLIITMSLLSENAKKSIQLETTQMYGNMDLSIGYNTQTNKVIDSELLRKLTSFPQIDRYSSVLLTRMTVDHLKAEVYTIGAQNDKLVKSKYHFESELSNDNVIVNKSLAEAMGITVGSDVSINNKTYHLTEVIADLNESGLTTDVLIVSREQVDKQLKEKTGIDNKATYILMKLKKDADRSQLTAQLQQLDPDLRIDLAEDNEFLVGNLRSLNLFMIVLSVLVLVVASLFVNSNSESFMYKYNNQMAIMRSIGATRSQLFKVIWIQLSILNVCGTIVGYLFALFSNHYIQQLTSAILDVNSTTSAFNHNRALLVTIFTMAVIQLVMLIPSFKSSRVLPLKIIQMSENNDFTFRRVKTGLGYTLLILGIIATLGGVVKNAEGVGAPYFIVAALLIMFGIFRLFPFYLPRLLNRSTPVLKVLVGKLSYVAIRNVIPQVRRNTYIIYMISIFMIILMLGSTLFETIRTNSEINLKTQYPTDVVVTSRTGVSSNIDPNTISKAISNIDESLIISTLSTPSQGSVKLGNRMVTINYGLADLSNMENQGIIPELRQEDLNKGIVITSKFASDNNLKKGDSLDVFLFSESLQKDRLVEKVIVEAIVKKLPGSYLEGYVDWSVGNLKTSFNVFEKMYIQTNHSDITLDQLDELKQMYPGQLAINSFNQAVERSDSMLIQRWSIFIMVLIIVLLSVMMGTCNTLLNNIRSKRKEFAILRTLAVTRNGLMLVMVTQVILFILIGIILGAIIGFVITFIIGQIDSGNVYYNISLVSLFVILMLILVIIIFVPSIYRMTRTNLIAELTQDNK